MYYLRNMELQLMGTHVNVIVGGITIEAIDIVRVPGEPDYELNTLGFRSLCERDDVSLSNTEQSELLDWILHEINDGVSEGAEV